MKRSVLFVVVVLGIGVAALSARALVAQDDVAQVKTKVSAEQKAAVAKARAERVAAFTTAVAGAKTSLCDAIKAAETKTGGKAFAAEFEMTRKHGLKLGVDVMKDGKFFEAIIDPATGVVSQVDDDSDDDASDDDGDDDSDEDGEDDDD